MSLEHMVETSDLHTLTNEVLKRGGNIISYESRKSKTIQWTHVDETMASGDKYHRPFII